MQCKNVLEAFWHIWVITLNIFTGRLRWDVIRCCLFKTPNLAWRQFWRQAFLWSIGLWPQAPTFDRPWTVFLGNCRKMFKHRQLPHWTFVMDTIFLNFPQQVVRREIWQMEHWTASFHLEWRVRIATSLEFILALLQCGLGSSKMRASKRHARRHALDC